jgi:hypothetical protein
MDTNHELLERQLTAMSTALEYPATPDLTAGFWRRLESRSAPRSSLSPLRLAGFALAAVVALALAVVVVAPARDAAAGLISRINIFETNESTDGLPTYITGTESTLEQAQTALGRHIAQPSDPNLKLDRVLLQHFGNEYIAVLFYRGEDESFALFASNAGVLKGLPTGGDATAAPVDGLGSEAYWLTGHRIVKSVDARGSVIAGSERVTDANTLIWDQAGYVYRIEGDLTRDVAVRIALSLRG